MDPNRPNAVLFPRDDTINYKGPKLQDSRYDSSFQPIVPGQELFEQHKQDYIPQLSLDDSSYFYIYISGQIEFAVFHETECLMVKYMLYAGNS